MESNGEWKATVNGKHNIQTCDLAASCASDGGACCCCASHSFLANSMNSGDGSVLFAIAELAAGMLMLSDIVGGI
jgi:hypothetical protein